MAGWCDLVVVAEEVWLGFGGAVSAVAGVVVEVVSEVLDEVVVSELVCAVELGLVSV